MLCLPGLPMMKVVSAFVHIKILLLRLVTILILVGELVLLFLNLGFNTVEEAVDSHYKKYPDDEWSREELAAEICQLLYNYHMNREEYDEASKYENYKF